MAKKATLTPVTDTVNNAGAINTQLNLLNEKLDNTLSLDGSAPNAMQADIDLNNNDLINIGTINGSDATGLGPNLDAVAAISGDVAAVSAISADVVTNAANIVAIQNAAANAASAAADAISAAASFDSFDDRFLGSKVSEPTVDNDGDPLLEGAMYWNSTSNQIFIYDGVAFDTAAISSLNPNFTSVTVNGDISLQDNNKILLGGGNDLEIFHDGANSYINDVGTGSLYLKGSSDMSLQSATGENYFNAIANGATTLYYNNAAKIATNTSGVTVTGTVTADGLTVDTDTLHVDNVNSRVGINTTTPADNLQVRPSTSVNCGILITADPTGISYINLGDTDDTNIGAIQYNNSTNALAFYANDSERMRITSGGSLLVGTTTDPGGSGKIVANSGVYLGGTVAANLLDDYEEGTFTPTVNGDATGVLVAAEGYYTKVGRLVTVEVVAQVGTNFTSNSLGGLPFTVADLATASSIAQNTVVLPNNTPTEPIFAAANENTTTVNMYIGSSGSTHAPNTTLALYRFMLSYMTA